MCERKTIYRRVHRHVGSGVLHRICGVALNLSTYEGKVDIQLILKIKSQEKGRGLCLWILC